jgi:four helix bundle protein
MAFLFKKLDVYQLVNNFVRETSLLTDRFGPKQFALSDQLRRASLSISANIAEGYGRWHIKEKSQFYRIALGSASECVALLDAACEQGAITVEKRDTLCDMLDRVCKMLQNLIRSIGHRHP